MHPCTPAPGGVAGDGDAGNGEFDTHVDLSREICIKRNRTQLFTDSHRFESVGIRENLAPVFLKLLHHLHRDR